MAGTDGHEHEHEHGHELGLERENQAAQSTEQSTEPTDEQPRQARKRRRVTTSPPVGSDPHPTSEPERHPVNENDERLKGDKPPHWG